MLRTPVNFAFPTSRGARDYARLAELLLDVPDVQADLKAP
jgi:hypothetical protein